jgi:hypothetical protein
MKSSLRFWKLKQRGGFSTKDFLTDAEKRRVHWRSADQSEQIHFARRKSCGVTKIENKITAVTAGVRFPVDFESKQNS